MNDAIMKFHSQIMATFPSDKSSRARPIGNHLLSPPRKSPRVPGFTLPEDMEVGQTTRTSLEQAIRDKTPDGSNAAGSQ